MPSTNPRVFLATESLAEGNGGISRVARLLARVVQERVRRGDIKAASISLSDRERPGRLDLPISIARSSRLRYVTEVYNAALRYTHFVYDCLGMSRAHCRIPGFRRPSMAYIHGVEVWEECRPDRISAAQRATFLVANSEYTRKRAQRTHPVFGRAAVCWLATEADEPPGDDASRNGRPQVLVCGRAADAYKGHAMVIDSWDRVADAVPDAKLTIVGRGTEKLAPLTASCRSRDRIEILGFVPDERLERLFSGATTFALPSKGEGFGLVYIEAMRFGIPVVASIHDAASEINLDGVTGYNVDLDKRDDLADRLIELLRERDRSARLGAQGRRRWAEHFRYSAFRARFSPILDQLLAS